MMKQREFKEERNAVQEREKERERQRRKRKKEQEKERGRERTIIVPLENNGTHSNQHNKRQHTPEALRSKTGSADCRSSQ